LDVRGTGIIYLGSFDGFLGGHGGFGFCCSAFLMVQVVVVVVLEHASLFWEPDRFPLFVVLLNEEVGKEVSISKSHKPHTF
jgi:hypothetical protein